MQLQNRVMPCPKIAPQDKNDSVDNSNEAPDETPYEKLMHSLHYDPKWLEEVNLGRRVGLYKFRGELGCGNFSQVKLAVHQLTKERVAVKIMDKGKLDDKMRRMLNQEISTMEAIHHPNLIRLYEVVETYSKLYLVMEYASGGELYNRVTTCGKLEEVLARQLFAQICSAVNHMHGKNIIHRDIKAENVFFSGPSRVKLGDFGFSAQLTSGRNQLLNTFCGSPPYAAPELFCDENYLGGPVDVWALGILLYFMVIGRMPFRGQTVSTLKESILAGVYPLPRFISRECADLIDGIIKQNPKERLTIEEILSSDWLKGITLPPAPDASQEYTLAPTIPKYCPPSEAKPVQYSEIEKTARERLEELGITSQLLASQSSQGSRSHVIGCYRIIIHRVQKQLGVFVEVDGFLPPADPWSRKTNSHRNRNHHHHHQPQQQQNNNKSPEKKFQINNVCQKKPQNDDLFSNCWGRKASTDDEIDAKDLNDTKDKSDRLSLAEMGPVESKARISIFPHRQSQSAAVKGGVCNPVPAVVRSTTCTIL